MNLDAFLLEKCVTNWNYCWDIKVKCDGFFLIWVRLGDPKCWFLLRRLQDENLRGLVQKIESEVRNSGQDIYKGREEMLKRFKISPSLKATKIRNFEPSLNFLEV